ncbi:MULTISPECIES: LysR substrate-binding domain-containing protein [Rhodococcus]|uniref:LysR substrate-binding domain-containing protein n=1 Tax=Rhodococcus TaxID=1827 RepID=UPI00135A2C64|nr:MULTISPECIES: LysR substrate-binding domain-containing protein [Rhodococcus]KAF0964526.1 Hca operon transcriptional activator HcaR [Rhodococcus sp. T7]WKX01980.1 LysR substrate-binding domain-containing protein [Rhodococcus aetherivorans]
METRHLRYFIAVAEERHFGRAALRLHMAQPPLSQQIRQLEDQLGTPLLLRTTRKVELTPAGRLLLDRGRVLLDELEVLESDVQQVGAGATGVIRAGFTGTATYRLMPIVVQAARRSLPGLRITVQGEMLTPQMETALEEGRLDIAVLRPPVRSGMVALKLLEQDQLVAALPADSMLAEKGTLELEDLAEQDFISYPSYSAVSSIFVDACRKAGFQPRLVQEAKETSTLLSLVAAGMGVALVPMTSRLFSFQGVVFRPLRNPLPVDLAVAWNRNNETPLLRSFLTLFDSLPTFQPAGAAKDSSHEN